MSRKKIVVTGAGSGIGKATAQRFAAEGYDVLLNDINKVKLDEVLSTLPARKKATPEISCGVAARLSGR